MLCNFEFFLVSDKRMICTTSSRDPTMVHAECGVITALVCTGLLRSFSKGPGLPRANAVQMKNKSSGSLRMRWQIEAKWLYGTGCGNRSLQTNHISTNHLRGRIRGSWVVFFSQGVGLCCFKYKWNCPNSALTLLNSFLGWCLNFSDIGDWLFSLFFLFLFHLPTLALSDNRLVEAVNSSGYKPTIHVNSHLRGANTVFKLPPKNGSWPVLKITES